LLSHIHREGVKGGAQKQAEHTRPRADPLGKGRGSDRAGTILDVPLGESVQNKGLRKDCIGGAAIIHQKPMRRQIQLGGLQTRGKAKSFEALNEGPNNVNSQLQKKSFEPRL